MDKLDEERLELVRRTANFAAMDAARALKRSRLAIFISVIACAFVVWSLR